VNLDSGRSAEKVVTPTISSLALLKVSYDQQGKDYFENFVPMVAECLRRSPGDLVSLQDLQSDLRERFGLSLPQNALRTVLKRAKKYEYVLVENGAYYRNEEKLERLKFRGEQQRVMQEHDSLIEEFVEFCSRHLSAELSPEDADAALQSYLEENQLQLVNAVTHGTVVPPSGRSVKNFRYLVSSFVRYLQETHSAALGYLETVVKGHMLADAIFLPDPGNAARKFRVTEVYFDTPFLLNALGYGGEAQREPCVELLELFYEMGADLRCFAHTRDEIRGVLESFANQLQTEDTGVTPGPDVLRNFRSIGYSKTDVMMLSNDLEKDLKALRIRVVDKPSHSEYEYQVDEDALCEILEEGVDYSRPQQISRDVDSISAIMRLRRGRRPVRIEESGALFVTTNSALVGVVQRHFSDGSKASDVSPCLTDYTLTNLLWLKKPTSAPDLPRKRIIADCYAATRPTERLWRLYLEEIDRLKQKDGLTPDEYYLLRYSIATESALMEITMGEVEGFTQGTVPEILERVLSVIEAKKQAEVDTERAVREATEGELEALRKRDDRRRARIKARAQRYASSTVLGIKISLIVVLALATVYSFGWGLPFVNIPGESYLAIVPLLILLAFSIANFWNGTSIKDIGRRCEVALEKQIERRFLAIGEEE